MKPTITGLLSCMIGQVIITNQNGTKLIEGFADEIVDMVVIRSLDIHGQLEIEQVYSMNDIIHINLITKGVEFNG